MWVTGKPPNWNCMWCFKTFQLTGFDIWKPDTNDKHHLEECPNGETTEKKYIIQSNTKTLLGIDLKVEKN